MSPQMGGTQTKGTTVGDRSALTLRFNADGKSDDLLKAIITAMEFDPTDPATMRDAREGELMDEETLLGSDADLFDRLLHLIENGREDADTGEMIPVEDFAFAILQDPKYEYDGSLRKHTPGQPDFESPANASWQVILHNDTLASLLTRAVETAETMETQGDYAAAVKAGRVAALTEVRATISTLLGMDHDL